MKIINKRQENKTTFNKLSIGATFIMDNMAKSSIYIKIGEANWLDFKNCNIHTAVRPEDKVFPVAIVKVTLTIE